METSTQFECKTPRLGDRATAAEIGSRTTSVDLETAATYRAGVKPH
jgi:hypothetical protein